MKGKLLLTVLLLVAVLVLPGTVCATVTDEVKKTADEVVRILENREMSKPANEQKRRAALKSAIGRIFDYEEMTRRSLGRHWQERSPAEQKEFVRLFETLLENSYAGKIETANQSKIIYQRETVDGNYAEVKSRVITSKRDDLSLDYRLVKKGDRWMVYDVVIEGVSLVSNYRSQFARIIAAQGYGELVKKLRLKSDEIKAP
jgi:phospholipid transport system substrate-binding protein